VNCQTENKLKTIVQGKIQAKINLILLLMFSEILLINNLFAIEYKVAVRAHNGIKDAYEMWQPTVKYLSEKIPEHTFRLIPIVNLNDLKVAAANDDFDFVLTNPSSYIELAEYYGTTAIATLNNKRANTAQDHFGSVIFIHASNDNILNLRDLHGKSLMAVAKLSFGGWIVAWGEFYKQGIDPIRDFKTITYSKTSRQQEVVYAVRDGKVDAGVVRTDQLERMESAGKIDLRNFRILNNKDIKSFPFFLSTDLYPEWAFAAMKNTPAKIIQQVKIKLLSLKRNSFAAIKGKYINWLPAKNYSPVEQLMKQLKAGPYSAKKNM